MTRSIFKHLVVVFFMLVASSCNKDWLGGGETEERTIVVGGLQRDYHLYLPADYEPSQTYPLVFVLHGRLGTGKSMIKFASMNPEADETGVIVCYPDGHKRSWADDRNTTPASQDGVDDIAFFNALIDQIGSEHLIDGQRIYACGMSNGGFMSVSLACHLSDRIAAVAAVTGNMAPDPAAYCTNTSPIGILLIGGTDDPVSPYNGGIINESEGSEALGFPACFDHWVAQNSCVDAVRDSVWTDMDPDDETTVVVHSHSSCNSGVTVALYQVNGMGHTWPQGPQYGFESNIGTVSQEFNGSRVILDFLLEHTLD